MRSSAAALSRLVRRPCHPFRLHPAHPRSTSPPHIRLPFLTMSTSTTSHINPTTSHSSPPPPSSSYPPFKAGVIQLNSGADYDANFQQCSTLIRKAVSLGAQVVFTPENTTRLTALTMPFSIPSAHYESDHPSILQYRQLSRELNVWLSLGSVAVRAEDDPTKLANRSLLISPCPSPSSPTLGRIIARYDKVHMFDVPALDSSTSESYLESARVRPGSRVPVVATPFGRVGLTVCYDLRFPALYLALALQGAHVMTVPSAFTATTGKAHWEALLRARAIETGAWVVAAAQSGQHPGGRVTWGRSMVVNPWGEVVGQIREEGAGMMLVDIDPAQVDDARRRVPSLNNRRPFEVVSVDGVAEEEAWGDGDKQEVEGEEKQPPAQSQSNAL